MILPDTERADWCDECGARHSPERRQAVVRRMLPATSREIADTWPHLYPDCRDRSASQRTLHRDLRAVGAVPRSDGTWTLGVPARRTA